MREEEGRRLLACGDVGYGVGSGDFVGDVLDRAAGADVLGLGAVGAVVRHAFAVFGRLAGRCFLF